MIMKIRFAICFISSMILIGCESRPNSASKALEDIVSTYQEHEGYDEEAYPLGLFTREHYEAEAEFARDLLAKLKDVDASSLSETERISLELLPFVLQDKIDYYQSL